MTQLSNNNSSATSWWQAFSLYHDRRLWRIFGLGLASGFPWVMIGSAMSAWLAEEGISRSSIGFFGFIFVAYSINFLWSPLIDRIRLPLLGSLLGQRRAWIVLMQLLIAACCWALAALQPSTELALAKLVAFALALSSATQDISIDAYRIDSLPDEDARLMSAGSAMATAGWWTGFAGLGAIPLYLVDLSAWNWADVYHMMSWVMLGLILVPLLAPEPKSNRQQIQQQSSEKYRALISNSPSGTTQTLGGVLVLIVLLMAWLLMGLPGLSENTQQAGYGVLSLVLCLLLGYLFHGLAALNRQGEVGTECSGLVNTGFGSRWLVWLLVSFVEPLAEFFRRNGVQLALSILLFIFLFKIGEAFLGRMSIVFYKELGFSNADIALYSKLVSWWVTIVFSLLGSVVTIHYGVLRGLFIGGLAMAGSNLMFALMAIVGANKGLLVSAVVVDGFTTAWSTVAFVAFLSMLCNRAFTASQYALMASLGTLGRTFFASYSGWVVDELGGNWAVFFVVTSLMVVPSLLLLYRIRHRLRELSSDF